jgi:hypothetical protein
MGLTAGVWAGGVAHIQFFAVRERVCVGFFYFVYVHVRYV